LPFDGLFDEIHPSMVAGREGKVQDGPGFGRSSSHGPGGPTLWIYSQKKDPVVAKQCLSVAKHKGLELTPSRLR
jgi:hypothetical protein